MTTGKDIRGEGSGNAGATNVARSRQGARLPSPRSTSRRARSPCSSSARHRGSALRRGGRPRRDRRPRLPDLLRISRRQGRGDGRRRVPGPRAAWHPGLYRASSSLVVVATRYVSLGSVIAMVLLPPVAGARLSRAAPVVVAAAARRVLIVPKHRENLRGSPRARSESWGRSEGRVLGRGLVGNGAAIEFARSGHEVLLWGRDPEVAAGIEADGRHPRRLRDSPIPPTVRGSAELGRGLRRSDTLFAVRFRAPSLRPARRAPPLGRAAAGCPRPRASSRHAQAHDRDHAGALCRSARSPRSPARRSRRAWLAAIRRRPSSPRATRPARTSSRAALSSPRFRLYRSDDVVGVELAGALKNVVAIAAGIVAGLGFGPNTLAALVTRGLTEIGRIVRAGGGQDRTVHGLAGIGDLMLTCTGQQSRNRFVGEQVGRGRQALGRPGRNARGGRGRPDLPRRAPAGGGRRSPGSDRRGRRAGALRERARAGGGGAD